MASSIGRQHSEGATAEQISRFRFGTHAGFTAQKQGSLGGVGTGCAPQHQRQTLHPAPAGASVSAACGLLPATPALTSHLPNAWRTWRRANGQNPNPRRPSWDSERKQRMRCSTRSPDGPQDLGFLPDLLRARPGRTQPTTDALLRHVSRSPATAANCSWRAQPLWRGRERARTALVQAARLRPAVSDREALYLLRPLGVGPRIYTAARPRVYLHPFPPESHGALHITTEGCHFVWWPRAHHGFGLCFAAEFGKPPIRREPRVVPSTGIPAQGSDPVPTPESVAI